MTDKEVRKQVLREESGEISSNTLCRWITRNNVPGNQFNRVLWWRTIAIISRCVFFVAITTIAMVLLIWNLAR